MNCDNITITEASLNDLSEILALLSRVDLPHDGVAENVETFLIAKDESSRLIATIGMERHGKYWIAEVRSRGAGISKLWDWLAIDRSGPRASYKRGCGKSNT